MTRAGFPARTTLSPKDLVTTAPAPATTLSPSVTPGRMVTPPPAQKLSPIVIGAPYSETRIALVWIQWMQGRQNWQLGPIMAFFPIVMGHTSNMVKL